MSNAKWYKVAPDWRTRLIVWTICVALGAGAAIGMATIAKGSPDRGTPTSYECPTDMPGCAKSPRQHRNQFRDGYYRKPATNIRYGRALRRRILRVAERKWENRRSTEFRQVAQWRRFTRRDTCVQNTYPANSVRDCWHHRNLKDEDYARLEKVMFCGTTLIVALGARSPQFAVYGGGMLCGWQYASKNLS